MVWRVKGSKTKEVISKKLWKEKDQDKGDEKYGIEGFTKHRWNDTGGRFRRLRTMEWRVAGSVSP